MATGKRESEGERETELGNKCKWCNQKLISNECKCFTTLFCACCMLNLLHSFRLSCNQIGTETEIKKNWAELSLSSYSNWLRVYSVWHTHILNRSAGSIIFKIEMRAPAWYATLLTFCNSGSIGCDTERGSNSIRSTTIELLLPCRCRVVCCLCGCVCVDVVVRVRVCVGVSVVVLLLSQRALFIAWLTWLTMWQTTCVLSYILSKSFCLFSCSHTYTHTHTHHHHAQPSGSHLDIGGS